MKLRQPLLDPQEETSGVFQHHCSFVVAHQSTSHVATSRDSISLSYSLRTRVPAIEDGRDFFPTLAWSYRLLRSTCRSGESSDGTNLPPAADCLATALDARSQPRSHVVLPRTHRRAIARLATGRPSPFLQQCVQSRDPVLCLQSRYGPMKPIKNLCRQARRASLSSGRNPSSASWSDE